MAEKSEINSLESLNKQKLLREIENIRRDTDIKAKELQQKFWRNTSVIVGVFSLLGVLVTQLFVLKNQNKQYEKENAERAKQFSDQIALQKVQFELNQKLDRKKHKGEMLIKAFDGKDTTETKKRILFLIDNHLVDDPNDTLRKAANKPNLLPSNKPTPTFNMNSAMPTITLANASRSPCSEGNVDGCYQPSVTGVVGDVIAVHLYFHNSSNVTSKGTILSIEPKRTNNLNEFSFVGSVLSQTVRMAVGRAHLHVANEKPKTIVYLKNDARWSIDGVNFSKVIPEELFGKFGLNIGDMPPNSQGTLVVRFLIEN